MNLHIRWRIALPYIFLILFIMTMTAIYLAYNFRQQSLEKLQEKVALETSLLAEGLSHYSGEVDVTNEDFDEFAATWSELLDARVTIIAPDGVVLGESQADRFSMDNHLNRPEVQQSLSSGLGRSIRYSRTEGKEFMYTAAPVYRDGALVSIVRIAITTEQVQSDTANFIRPIILITILGLILAVILAAVIAEYLSRPVRQLTEAVKQVTVEDLNLTPILSSQDELGQLANAFEAVVLELQNQVRTFEQERRKLEAVLEQLNDGVVIVDQNGLIQMINPAAKRIFNIEGVDAVGQSLAIVARHHDIVTLWKTALGSEPDEINSIEIATDKIVLQAFGISLSESIPGSSLLVFHDVTRIRHLETVRRDFISNISHELRTPLASLKALTETLQDGALEDKKVADHFLNRMEIEVDSVSLIVQELLELSRIESGRVPLNLESVDPCELINAAVERLRLQAESSGLELNIICPDNLPHVLADHTRLEQVLVNLLHNAIKFTPSGGSITIKSQENDEEIHFSVSDTGAGISSDDFPRIFERFYKADRARAGGGTGLGLAISKHLVEAHNGEIWAESVEGQGSIFTFSVPKA
jgi:two-component system phosphate regulon sensor histidine kinase PhoR